MKRTILFTLAILACLAANAGAKRNLLTDSYNRAFLEQFCKGGTEWVRFPSYSDREAWNGIPREKREATIAAGEKYLGFGWPAVLPSMYLEFTRTGNRSVVDSAIANRLKALRSLLLAELAEGKGRFLDDIINGVFAYCEQTYWGSSAHFYLYEYGSPISDPTTVLPDAANPIIDLTVGDVASTLSWTWYFLHEEFDKVSPVINERLLSEMHEKVLDPYYSRNDFWWMTGWNSGNVNNWTPWCSYNVLTSILLLEKDPAKRLDGVAKSMQSVDLFINSYPDDGGCNEGPSYWGAAVGQLYNYLSLLWDWSGGRIDIFGKDIIREMGRYICKLYIGGGDRYVNFADAPARIVHDGIKIARYGRDIGDSDMEGFGAFLADKSGTRSKALSGDIGTALSNTFLYDGDPSPSEILLGEAWLPDLEVAVARDRKDSQEGFFFAAKGGNNAEQHNHNDVGSFILYYNGSPVFIDPGVGTYTRQTFSSERYRIWTMQSAFHNLPVINGVMQHEGGLFKAEGSSFKASPSLAEFSTDIAKAYPEDAAVAAWTRKYSLIRGKEFRITDSYSLEKADGRTEIMFLTPLECELHGGKAVLSGDGFTLVLSSPVEGRVEDIPMEDSALRGMWGERLHRLVFPLKDGKARGTVTFTIRPARAK